jgi:hypothetical protein
MKELRAEDLKPGMVVTLESVRRLDVVVEGLVMAATPTRMELMAIVFSLVSGGAGISLFVVDGALFADGGRRVRVWRQTETVQ